MLPDTETPPTPPPPTRKRRVRRIVVASVLAVTLVAGGTSAWALNRFVIDHVEISDVAAYEASLAAAAGTTASGTAASTSGSGGTSADDSGVGPVITDTSYASDDSNITISTVVTGSGDSTVTYYVADVVLDDATELRSAFAENSFGE